MGCVPGFIACFESGQPLEEPLFGSLHLFADGPRFVTLQVSGYGIDLFLLFGSHKRIGEDAFDKKCEQKSVRCIDPLFVK